MKNQMDAAEILRIEEANRQRTESEKVEKENDDPRKMIKDDRQRVDDLTWQSFRKRGQKSTVLIADGQRRHVCDSKLIDTDVRCKRGKKIADVARDITDLNRGHDQLTVMIGGNDCTGNEPSTAESVVEKYSGLIDTAKEKARNVTLVSIPPQIPSQEVRERIVAVNAGLSTK